MIPRSLFLSPLAALALAVAPASANEAWTDIACRSVHLHYDAPECAAFYNEVRVQDTVPGSYFEAAGWDCGYFGIQERANEKDKVVIFSVWDSDTTNDQNAVAIKERVKLIYSAPGVNVSRFGGEGTGGHSDFKYDWSLGEVCRFVVTARPAEAGRTEYTGFLYITATKSWKRLVTFSTPAKHKGLTGLYSFVEDFRRDRKSKEFTRRAEFGPGFVLTGNEWKAVTRAKFTGDSNRSVNIDAGLIDGRFFLATGGNITNKTAPLWSKVVLAGAPVPPSDLADVAKRIDAMPVTPDSAAK